MGIEVDFRKKIELNYKWTIKFNTVNSLYMKHWYLKVPHIKNYSLENLPTVDSCYLEVEWTLSNTSRYPYFDISDVQNWGKYQSNNQISQMNM